MSGYSDEWTKEEYLYNDFDSYYYVSESKSTIFNRVKIQFVVSPEEKISLVYLDDKVIYMCNDEERAYPFADGIIFAITNTMTFDEHCTIKSRKDGYDDDET